MVLEQEPAGQVDLIGSEQTTGLEPIVIVSRAELKARLIVLQGKNKNPHGLVTLRDPVLDKPSFDGNFGVPVDPLARYRTIDTEGIIHIVPESDRRNY